MKVRIHKISVTKLNEKSYGRGQHLYKISGVDSAHSNWNTLTHQDVDDQDCWCITPGQFVIVNDVLAFGQVLCFSIFFTWASINHRQNCCPSYIFPCLEYTDLNGYSPSAHRVTRKSVASVTCCNLVFLLSECMVFPWVTWAVAHRPSGQAVNSCCSAQYRAFFHSFYAVSLVLTHMHSYVIRISLAIFCFKSQLIYERKVWKRGGLDSRNWEAFLPRSNDALCSI